MPPYVARLIISRPGAMPNLLIVLLSRGRVLFVMFDAPTARLKRDQTNDSGSLFFQRAQAYF